MLKVPIGVALHQWPKQGDYRKFLKAPPGHFLVAGDVDSQETKLMTCFSRDQAMLDIYAQGLNPHGVTAAAISGVSYSDIMSGKDENGSKMDQLYKAGKVTDLGENYRMGAHTLWNNAHVQWGLRPTIEEATHWKKTWQATYSGIQEQWGRFIDLAKINGYAETLAGRRYYISEWGANRWKSEASAIMVPIQGSGAEMKYLAIAMVRRQLPHLKFWSEIHDEVLYICPDTYNPEVVSLELKRVLDSLPYKEAWDWEPIVPFTWSVAYGLTWGDLEEIG